MTSTADTVPKVNKIQSNYKPSFADLKALARGQWPSIFTSCGMPSNSFYESPNKHVNCPFPNHGGTKDFRFDNKNGDGSYICSCSSGADGFNAIATFHGIENKDAIKLVLEYFNQNNINAQPYIPFNEKSQKTNNEKPLAKKRAGYHSDKILSTCELKPHLYLQNKNIDDSVLVITRNYKVNEKQTVYRGALIVKVYDVDNPESIIGIQFINPDGQRFYITDTKNADGIHIIEGDSSLPYVDVVEGYATGISANMITGATTVVAFDANGLKGKAERIQKLFYDKQLRFLGDNDSHKRWTGNEAAHTAALKTGGLVAIPPMSGDDWDDQRKANGIEGAQMVMNAQFAEYNKNLEISEKITGISITSSIVLSTESKIVSLDDALINYSGKQCVCPISGGKAVINAGFLYSFTQKRTLIPVLFNLYDQNLIDKCAAIKSTKGRLKWVAEHNTQKHLYAFIRLIHHRLGADLPNHEFFNERMTAAGVSVSPEIMSLIKCLQESRINQAKKLTKLEPKEFSLSKHIKLRQKKMEDGSLMLDWEPALNESKIGKYKLIAIKAQHGQGKTQSFIKRMLKHANSLSGGVVIAHRRKLIAQISKELNCCNYEDYDKRYYSGVSLPALNGIAVCINSFKHEHFLSYLKQSHSVFIDEASQVLKSLHTNKQLDELVLENIVESAKNAQRIYLTDADLTSKDIKHYQQLFDIKDDEILIVTAEPPERHYFVNISCSSAPRHYRTKVVQSIIKNLQCNAPCVLAVESETQGQSIFKYLSEQFKEKNIRLLTTNTPEPELKLFIENITEETEKVDLLIHTSLMGTGVSVQHKSKRFKKGYGLFSGSVLTATECLQMMRRFRDIDEWEVGLLCRPESMVMTSFHNNLGAKALSRHGIETNNILSEIKLDDIRNKAIFIHAFVGLLRDEYKFKIVSQLASNETIKGMMTNENVREETKQKIIKAIPQQIDKAMLARKRGYRDYAERYSSEAAICIDYFKCDQITEEAAEIWCNPSAKDATERLEKIIKILSLDSSIHKVEKANEILNKSGITLNLIKEQRLSQEAIKNLTYSISSHCAELVGLGLLRERYSKETKIPKERPIKFVTEFLKFIGLTVKTVRTRTNDREYQLDISVIKPIISRLGIDARTDKEVLREKALKLRSDGLGYGLIAKRLELKDKYQARRLLET